MRHSPHLTARQRHLRRRAQRAEDEARLLRAELAALRAEIEGEREALIAYVDGPRHEYDLLLATQAKTGEALREMAREVRTCRSCGGFSRAALDGMLGETLENKRAALGLPKPQSLPERLGEWPVRPGAEYYNYRYLRAFVTPEQREANRRRALYPDRA